MSDPRLHARFANLLTPAWFMPKMGPHALQSKLWRTTARFPVVVAGRGSGKSELFRRKIVRWLPVIKEWPDPVYCYCLPTYKQAKRIAWQKILNLIPREWLKPEKGAHYNIPPGANISELCITTIFGSQLYIVGMDKPARIEGMQIDGAVIDECSDQKPSAYTLAILPMLTHRDGWCARIGVPKRNGVGAKDFRQAYEDGLLTNDIGLESYTWASDTILTPVQLEAMKAQMSEKDAEEQFGGVWVDAEGQIFYAYSDTENVSSECLYVPSDRIGVGCDFNVNPMAWVLFHYTNGIFRVFDELWLKNTNTVAALDDLYRRYPTHKAGWTFIGDASSNQRRTSAATTDYIQMRNDGRFLNKRVIPYTKNPPILDRFASTNAIFKNAQGRRRAFIHPKCINLRSDLQVRTYKPGTREPNDDADEKKETGHITDAFGYAIHAIEPMRLGPQKRKISMSDG